MFKGLLLTTVIILAGCTTTAPLRDPASFTSNPCHVHFRDADTKDTDAQLDHVSDLFSEGCFAEVIQLAMYIRNVRRDKLYSVSAELAEVLTPEGTFSPYILESYERSYLSLLISLSYLNLHQNDEALVELRRTVVEENAWLYNSGQDPVISLLLAALWDRTDPATARAQWQRLSEYKALDPQIAIFAKVRLREIDQHVLTPVDWRIYALGQMPELEWHSQFFRAQPYQIVPRTGFPPACSSRQSLLVPTVSWTKKISTKYDSDYHPLLYVKSLTRLPVGLGYGLLGVSTGAAIGVAGCGAGFKAGDSGGAKLCEASLQAAGYVISKSANLVEFTLSPDMRRWRKLPLAVMVTRQPAGEAPEYCRLSQLDVLVPMSLTPDPDPPKYNSL